MAPLRQPEVGPAPDPWVRARSLFRSAAQRKLAGYQGGVAGSEALNDRTYFETVFSSAPIGMAVVDVEGRCLEVNDALCRITGQTRKQFEATPLNAITHPDDLDRDQRSFHDLLRGVIPSYQVEKRYRHVWGHYLWVLVTVALLRDQSGEPLYLVSQVQDISERKAQATHLEHLVDHDFLTGLFNQRRFREELAREVDRKARYGAEIAVLMIDLDNFKNINDTFGHRAGDDLQGVAGALRHRMRQTDIVARIGGDEFAMLLPDTDVDQAQIVAEGIVKTLGRQIAALGDRTLQVTASVGVAVSDNLGAAEVLECADLAMYEAKAAGRNRIVVHRPGSPSGGKVSRRTDVELIRTALDEGRMLLYCQPILDLAKNRVCRYELLLRLCATEGSDPLLPSAFLYVAERFDLIQDIDCWVVGRALELIAEHARAGRRLVLHVNLSGKSIGDPRLAALVEKAVSDAGVDPACLILELTETTVITRFEEAKTFACRLSALGCRLALDDFAAGFGTFHYLRCLPFDYLKIDGDLVRRIVTSPTEQLVIGAIVGIARGMGKKTIAEFVADADTCRLLAKGGVDYVQGHYVGQPRPLSAGLPAV